MTPPLGEETPAPAPAANGGESAAPVDPTSRVKAQLAAMGFEDAALVDAALAKHGADAEACAVSLAAASEWEGLLTDLAEMGFHDSARNKALMLKHAGNIKRTVKELVEES